MDSNMERAGECVPYPLFVHLDGARVVCVGGGQVAARKVASLVSHGADVVVIAPEACERIKEFADSGAIEWVRRDYRGGDLDGALLAIVATSSRTVNELACAEAHEGNVLVNVVDAPERCSFIVPSVVRRGQLQVAVSTNGAAPSVAREVRLELEDRFPEWWGDYVDMLAEARAMVKQRVPGDASMRADLLEAIGSKDVRERFSRGEVRSALQVYEEVVEPMIGRGEVS